MDILNYNVTEHFKYEEFICPCCDRLKLVPGFFLHLEKLEEMRKKLGFRFIISSGYRCKKHNEAVGGAKRSWHMLFATDVTVEKYWPTKKKEDAVKQIYIEAISTEFNFGGVGRYKSFIHLDIRPTQVRWRE